MHTYAPTLLLQTYSQVPIKATHTGSRLTQALHLSALARSIVRTWIAPAEMRASFRRRPGDTHVLNSVQPLMLPRAQTYKEETD